MKTSIVIFITSFAFLKMFGGPDFYSFAVSTLYSMAVTTIYLIYGYKLQRK